jgi:predicted RNA methylase
VYYIASNWHIVRRALRRYEISPDDVFVDFGSGMGRVVVEASRFPFKRVIGVELASQLHLIAEDNVRRTRRRARCAEIDLVNSDVLDYDIPDDLTFVYMNNPFRGEIFKATVDKLIRSLDRHPRVIHVIYTNPFEEQCLLDSRRFEFEGAEKGARLFHSVDSYIG